MPPPGGSAPAPAPSVVNTAQDTIGTNITLNRQTANSPFTATIRATGSDGSTLAYHETTHFTMLPNGRLL